MKIAVLDSELDLKHREFESAQISYEEFVPSSKVNYHGTAVTSLIVGKDIGVAPEAEIHHLKILSDVFGSGSSWDKAVDRAIRLKVDIICMSIGTKSRLSPSMRQSLQRAKEKGIVVLAPSGNEGKFLLRNPAGDERVIAVGGRNSEGNISRRSNEHRDIEAYALSEDVLVANAFSDINYIKKNGTSFANAIVTGQMALIISYARGINIDIDARKFLREYNINYPSNRKVLNMKDIKKELDIFLNK